MSKVSKLPTSPADSGAASGVVVMSRYVARRGAKATVMMPLLS